MDTSSVAIPSTRRGWSGHFTYQFRAAISRIPNTASVATLDLALPAPYRAAMDRRSLLLTLLIGLNLSRVTEAQQRVTARRIGYLSLLSSSDPFPPRAAFRQGLRDLGWVESQNIVIE
jgi:hypothetical protein